jgi:hypothetical protein
LFHQEVGTTSLYSSIVLGFWANNWFWNRIVFKLLITQMEENMFQIDLLFPK